MKKFELTKLRNYFVFISSRYETYQDSWIHYLIFISEFVTLFSSLTRYIKFLYPYECHLYGFSTDDELQLAISRIARKPRSKASNTPSEPANSMPNSSCLSLLVSICSLSVNVWENQYFYSNIVRILLLLLH